MSLESSPDRGGGETRPFRIRLTSLNPVADGVWAQQEQENIKRGLPDVNTQAPLHNRTLAVVGGGPSVKERYQELHGYDEVWGINATADWLIRHGVDATFFTVDASPQIGDMVGLARRGIVASTVHRTVLDALDDVRIFFMEHNGHPYPICGGGTTATRAPMLALRMGFKDISFYGCEGSFEESTHLDRHEDRDDVVIIKAGLDFFTVPDFLAQSEYLADAIRTAPRVFKDCSGGLLAAMVVHWDSWEWAAVSEKYKEVLERENGRVLFPDPYEVA